MACIQCTSTRGSSTLFSRPTARRTFSTPIPLYRSVPLFRPVRDTSSGVCRATSLGPRPPPPGKDSVSSKGFAASFSRFKDRAQIFLAVLFWMSLFFWASAWDGRNKKGRPNKGSRFKRWLDKLLFVYVHWDSIILDESFSDVHIYSGFIVFPSFGFALFIFWVSYYRFVTFY